MGNDKSSSKFLEQAKHFKDEQKKSIKKEYYIPPQKFESKTAKKDNQIFYVSKINKPAKFTKDGNILSTLIYRIGKDNATGLAAQLSYYFLLALFPTLIFVLTLIPLFQVNPDTITNMISENAPGDTAKLITGIIDDVMNNASGGLFSFGLIAALWSASNGMTALMNAFNVAYDVEDGRNAIILKIMSVFFTVIMVVVFGIAIALPIFGQQIGNLLFGPLGLESELRWIFSLIKVVLPLIVTFIVFITLYTLAPNIKIKLLSVVPGAAFTTVAWLGSSALFGLYVNNFANYSKTYGSIGGIIVLMIWLFLTGLIIIIGAEINAVLHQKKMLKNGSPEEQAFNNLTENGDMTNASIE